MIEETLRRAVLIDVDELRTLLAEVPGLDASMAKGDVSAATAWLRDRLQQHGSLYEPRDVVRRACGFEPSEGPLLDYLEAKFGAIYGV